MLRDVLEAIVAAVLLLTLSPVLIVAALGVKLNSSGPVLYRAVRAGQFGSPFIMYKFRTMHTAEASTGPAITSANDSRVFRFGAFLRKSKIDELPQLAAIVSGHMRFIGPRPEDLQIVREHYRAWQMQTLDVKPGLASPGSIFNYTHGDKYLSDENPESSYLKGLLPVKLAIELVYLSRQSVVYDMRVALRTLWVIVLQLAGRDSFSKPPEFHEALMHLKMLDPDWLEVGEDK